MGITDSRAIIAKIEAEYKSIRKYCDPVYGEITVVQHKTTKNFYALIEKTFLKANTNLQTFLIDKNTDQCLLKPYNYHVCDLSLCSDIRLYFFLFEFYPKNLQQQITQRMNENRPFFKQQALNIFSQQIEIVALLKQKTNPESNKPYRLSVSNSMFSCLPLNELRILETVFKNDPEEVEDYQRFYMSPEAYHMVLNGQTYRAKEVISRQSSLVFTLALNFIELLLLADLSMIYEEEIDFQKLNFACQEVGEKYGEDFKELLIKMLQKEEYKRPNLFSIKKIIKYQKQGRRSISRFDRDRELSLQIC